MTLLLRRRPREIYRVFTEEEYLNGAGSGLAGIGGEWSFGESAVADEWPLVGSPPAGSPPGDPTLGDPSLGGSLLADQWPLGESPPVDPPVGEWPPGDSSLGEAPPVDFPLPVEPMRQGVGGEDRLRGRVTGEHRLHRMAGVAMLAGTVGAVCGMVVLNLARTHVGAGTRGGLVAAVARSSRVARSPAVDDAQPQVASRPVVVHSVETARSRVPPSGRSSGGPFTDRSKRSLIHRPVRRRANVAVVDGHVPHPSSGEASTAPATVVPAATPAQVSTTAASGAPAPQRPAPENRPEFGFER
jgi:hypothetical protein